MESSIASIYTDGSYNPVSGVGGWAAIILAGGEKTILRGMGGTTTHQRMELTAVIEALHYLITSPVVFQRVRVYTDSQYVADIPVRKRRLIINRFLTRSKIPIRNEDLVRLLLSAVNSLNVSFIKVKSHQKQTLHDYNREVDRLSRQIVRQKGV